MRIHRMTVCGLILSSAVAFAQDTPDTAARSTVALKTERDKVSYIIGSNIGKSLKRDGIEVDPAKLAAGLADALADKKLALTDDEIKEVMTAFQKTLEAKQAAMRAKRAAEWKALGEKNKVEGPKFLAANAKKPGVKTTKSGLQYKILKAGTGRKPKSTDRVKAHYHGTLIDGTVFDSSLKGDPLETPVNGVIKGWIEALQLMKVGAKWQLYVPAELAYRENPRPGGKIGPNAVLIFDIELVSIEGVN